MRCSNCRRTVLAATIAAVLAPLPAWAQLEEIIVTAQKREESAQDVPIAITAFDTSALKAQQIGTFGDFRFAVPNVSYARGNFQANNFSIRGIGTSVVAAGSDSGVEANVNEVPILFPRLFETRFFDVQQIAVLRGPQGTLFGRNSTGGAINMITNTADPSEFDAGVDIQLGNYDDKEASGMVNIPLGENFAVRFAGTTLKRDGFTKNIAPGVKDLDDRDQYAVRGSIRWTPSDVDTVDLMASYFDEQSARTRSQKQMCHNDPTAVYGCLPDKLAYENVNALSQLTGILPFRLSVFGPVIPGTSTGAVHNEPNGNPDELRKVNADFEPIYEADETLVTLRYSHEFDSLTAAVVAGYQDTSVYSLADYTMSLGQPAAASPLLATVPGLQPAFNQFFDEGCLPISAPSGSGTGIVGGHIANCTTTLDAFDQTDQETDQRTLEIRVASNFDGMFNFLAGGFYMEADTFNEYWVLATGLDYFAAVYPGLVGAPGNAVLSPNYLNRTNNYALESKALFGEAYLQFTDELKLTLGLRYNDDTKEIDDVQCLLCSIPPAGSGFYPFGYDDEAYLDSLTRKDSQDWQETTGRVVLDWSPDVGFTDSTLVYFSYSRGYKGGGYNPPIDYALAINAGIAETFDPEFIDAWEIGTKNQLLGNRLQVNLSAFYYDYQGLQVSKIFNRTSVNENADAEIFGFESEFLFAPDEHWQLNANLAYLKTEAKDFASVDTRDPTAGQPGTMLIKDNANASNCVLHFNGAPAPSINPIRDCSTLQNTLGAPYTVDSGIPIDLDGNQLQNAPEWQFSAGIQYTATLPQGFTVTPRLDYFWQDDMYARIFNQPIDKIDSWDIINAQITLRPAGENWYVAAFVKNIEDDANVVGMYVSDPSSGLFTNLFLIEPRTYGLTAGYTF